MGRPRNKIFLTALLVAYAPTCSFSELYLKPGDRGELLFTVENYADSVDVLDTPHVVYENQPQWFSMGGVLTHGPLAKGTSCELLIDYAIADNAPSGTSDLKFKVVFSSPNVYPPVWYPAANEKIVIDGSAPSLAVIQPQWFGYAASTTVVPSGGVSKIVRGPAVSFTAYDADSDIADFQIYDSSGQNLSAEYLSQTSGGISYSGNFAEGQYNVSALNKSGLSTTGKVYVDYTPEIAISTFTTTEASAGHFTDTFVLSARSYWGLGLVKLLPATFSSPDPLDASAFDAAIAVREFNGNGVSSATVVFQDIADGDYVVYAKNSLGSLSAAAVAVHSVTSINPETGSPMHSVQYTNPSSVYGDGGVVLNFGGKEKFTFNVSYGSVAVAGLNFVNSVPVVLPETISASYFTFPYGFGFTPKTSAVFTGNVSIRIDYRKAPFSQYQKDNARLYAYVDGAGWQNITSQAGDGWITGVSPSLAKLALVFPYAAAQPYLAKSSSLIGTSAEAELSSYFSGVALSAAATDQTFISDFISAQEAKGKYLVSDTFVFSNSNTELVPPGTLRFRYLATQLSRFGVSTDTLTMACAVNGAPLSLSGTVNSGADVAAFTDIVPQVCGLFAASKPKTPDMVTPESYMQYDGVTYVAPDGGVYVGPSASLRIYANDSAQAGVEMSGVSEIYYGADLSSGAIAAVATGDFSAFITYRSTFSLLEGTHTVTYFATDKAGNTEPVKQAMVYADYSGPEVALALLENQIIRNGTMYTSGVMPIVLSANDPEYAGVASGTSTIKILWDKVPEDCPSGVQYDPQQPWGTCANPGYHPQLNVSAGRHSLAYWAEDNVGNSGEINLQAVFIDTVAPDTTLYIGGVPRDDSEIVIPQASSITLTASDPVVGGDASGIKQTWLLIDRALAECTGAPTYTGPQGTCDNPVYKSTFTLSPGTHTVSYFSQDNVGNSGWGKSIRIICSDDVTPPETTLALNGSIVNSTLTISALTTDSVTINAIDPILGGTASGVKAIYFLIDVHPDACGDMGAVIPTAPVGSCQNYLYAGPFSLSLGSHTVYYTAIDNVGNTAALKSVSIQVGKKMPFPRGYEFTGSFPINSGYFPTRDKDGNFYVASFREISKYSPSGTFITKWGSYGSGPGQFSNIWAIRAGPDGNVYAVDAENRSIQKFTPTGAYLSTIKGMFQYPQGLDIDKDGNLYVSDGSLGQIIVVSPAGVVLRNIPIANCLDVFIDGAGDVYAGDNSAKVVKKFSKNGALLATYAMPPGIYNVFSIVVDPYGNLYVADIGNSSGSRIRVFNSLGNYIGEFGTSATTPGGALDSTITKMELDEESGKLYISQNRQMLTYKAVETMPATPRIVSPTGNTGVFNNQVMMYLQAASGQKVEVFDGDVLVGSGYADNAEGEFSTTLSLASGSHALSAKAKSNMGVESERTPTTNVSVQMLRAPVFSQAVSIPVRGYPAAQVIATTTVTGDFNGDNLQDVVAIGEWSYTVLLGRGDGTFDEQLSVVYGPYNWGGTPEDVAVWEAAAADVNKDGKLDFVMTSYGRLLTAIGYGDGTFRLVDSGYVPACGQQYTVNTDFRIGDVNRDGNPDVVESVHTATVSGGSCLYVMLGAGDGKFNLSSFKSGLSANGAVSLQDFNQDGTIDIANGQGIFWNDGSGTLENYQVLCSSCVKSVSADINSDGLPDLVYDYKFIRFNLGNGKFSRPIAWELNWLMNGTIGKPVISDFNGDNVPDLAVGVGNTYNDQGKVFVYSGYGDGRFVPDPITMFVGNNYSQLDTLSVADFNNDTRDDIVTALHFNTQYQTPELAFLYNNTLIPDMTPPAASVITVSPDTDGGAKVSWTAPGDDGNTGKAARYELRFAQTPILDNAGFAAAGAVAGVPVPKTAGVGESVVVSGLTGGVTYYFALKAYDEIGNASSLSNSPGFFAHYVARSTQTVDGKAEIFVISKVSPELTFIDSTSGDGALMAQSAKSQDLSAVGNVYKTGFGLEYDYSGVLTFRYSASALSAQGLLESEIGIYEYFPETGWSRLDGQVLNAADRKIIAPLNSTSTICGIFGSTPKLLSPSANAVLYSETPLFVGRICESCSLKVYESGILKGELTAQTGGFVSGNINFLPGTHEIEAVVVKSGAPQSAGIYRKFTVKPPFALTFDAPVMISTETKYDVGSSGLGVADFNGDKHDDLLIFGRNGYVSALGNGAGQFNFLTPVFITLNHVFRVENPDLNKDGKADIVAGNLYGGLLGAYGSGNGTFESIISLPNNLTISDDITYGDFNKDGNVDLALVGYNPATYTRDIALLRGQGGANFTRKYIARPVYSDGNVKFAEMDADSNTDLVNGGTVLYGDGQGNFPSVLTVDSNCMRSLVGDFNGDGNKDIACIRNYSSFVDIYASLKNRTYRKIQSLQFPTSPADVGVVVDMNNDGLDDLVIGSYSGKLYILTAKGDGTFAEPFAVSLDSRISTVKIIKTGDFDEDGKKDLAIGHYFASISPQAVSLVFNRSEGLDRIPPGVVSDLAVNLNGVSGALVLSWTAPGDDGKRGRAAGYDLRVATIPVTEANFGQAMQMTGVPAPGVSGSSESFTAAGLAAGATYYFALKTKDEVDNVSGISNSPGLFQSFIARSTSIVDGNTELSMISPVQPYIAQVSTGSPVWTIAIGEASGLSLTIGSGLFEILPEGDYNPPATLTFYYSTTTLSSVGLTEDDVAIYEHFADRSWVKLDGQVNDKLNHKITVPVTRIASLFGIFGVIKDKTPPLTDYVVEGSSRPFAAGIYISAASSISLGAYDPVVFGTSSGVAFTEFRVDASSTAPFSRYDAPFRFSTGTHVVEFRSVDKSGNTEKAHLLNVTVDWIAPNVAYSVIGKSFPGDGIVYVASGSSVTFVSTDTASGVSRLFYEVNGATYSTVSAEATIYLSSAGAYGISYNAEDNVGNTSVKQEVSLSVDTAAPRTDISLPSATGDNEWHISPVAVAISFADDMAGGERTYYRLDGSSFAVYAASFPVVAEGVHVLEAYSVDNVGNTGDIHAAVFKVDISTPIVNYSLSPAPNKDGWSSGPVDVLFAGTDTVSGVSYCSSSFTVAAEGLNIPVSGYCRDYAGWSSTSSFSLNIDTAAPVSIPTLTGFAGSNGWYVSPAAVALSAADNLSGLAGLYYSVDASSFAVYASTVVVAASGAHVFKYYAIDKADNAEAENLAEFKVDLEAPVVEAVVLPVPNVHGWSNSLVNVVFNGTDSVSGLAYCEPQKTFALEGSSQTVTGYCTDYAGWSSTASLILNIDTTSPRIDYTASPVANNLGWNNSEVLVKFACADNLSGIMSCPAEISLSAEGTDISTVAKTVDYAGNFAQAAVSGLKIDRTPPSSSIELSGPQRNGWYSGAITATIGSTDALSGIKEILYVLDGSTPAVYGAPLVVTGNGEHTIKYYASDNADNLEGYKSVGFRIDAEAPTVGYRQAPPHNAAGWNNTGVEIVFVGTDTMSGIEICSSTTVALEGQGMSISGWCRDLAGNVAYATATVNIDMTRPGLAAAAEPQPNTVGWNNSDVRIKYACEDGLSGVSDCPLGVVLSGEGVGISTQAVAYDYAGNISMSLVSAVKIDRTAPVSGVELSGMSRNGWYSGPVGIVIKSTDALAGIKEIRYALDNMAPAVYDGAVLVSGEGAHTLKYYAADNADNVEETRKSEFRIDSSSPAVSYTYTPQPNAAGWNNTAVAVAFSGEDGLSGIEVCSSATVAMEGRGVTVSGWCRDVAGNVSYATGTFNIDLTPAAIKIDSPLAGQTYIATRGNISIGFNIKDNLDPAPSVEAYLLQVEDKGSPRGTRPAKIAVTAGQSIEPLDIDDGLWRLEVSATDAAGNISHLVGGTFEVIHDMLPPRSSLSQAGPAYRPAGTNYLTSAAVFTVGSIDDLVAASDGIGLGVVSQDVKLNAGSVLLKELGFTNSRPVQGEVFSSTFSFAELPDGLYGLSYGARDVLGNAESAKDWAFALDNTPPMTQYNVSGVGYEVGGKLYMNSTASIGLAGVDVSSGGVASGILVVKFRLDDSAWGIYSSTFSIATSGAHVLSYQSLDNVQNAEPERQLAIVIDNAAPMAAASVGEPQYEVFGLRIITPETPVTLSAADPGEAGLASGIKGIYYELLDASGGSTGVRGYTEPIKLGTAGTYVLRYWAMDNAGNIGAPREQRLMVSSLQGDALDAVGGLDMSGSVDIAGAVKSNGVVSLGGSARILGDVSASTITLSGNAKITGQRVSGGASLVPVPLYMPAFVEIASNTNNNALIPAKYLSGGKLMMDAKAELILSTGVYYFTGIDLKAGSSVILNGKVDVMVAGNVSIAGGSSLNATGVSGKLNIFLSTVSALNFAGGGNLAAYVYAPYADLKLTGNALLGGHYFVKNAFVSGNGNIVQAGETLPTAVPASGGGGKKVSAMAVQDGTYGVLAGPSSEFRLGEVYAFPNPALRGAAPTFHIEVGVADRVKITIYTVSGRQAHETTLTGMPVALDDGNGLSYAYEYTWRDSIPSGVYFYHIEAEKSGQKIKKSGKFGVVR